MDAVDRLPLRAYRWNPRKPWLAVEDDQLVLRLPTFFGGHLWRVDRSDAVATAPEALAAVLAGEATFDPPLSVPYLFTTGPVTSPTVAILFRQLQRVPPVRLLTAIAPNTTLPFGYREARSERGGHVDGVLLRTASDDPLGELGALGLTIVDDPGPWLRQHRRTIQSPILLERARQWRRRTRAKHLASLALFFIVAVPGRIAADADPSWTAATLVFGGLAVAVALGFSARRAARRALPPNE